jgi:RecA-family ATPase
MKFITAKELYESNPDPVVWVCKPWLAVEAITELDGKAKTAGKTTFTLAMCRAIINGDEFLGEPTEKGTVVYLTEESRTTFRAALERAGIGESTDFHVLFWRETHMLQDREDLGTAWEQIVRSAIREAHKRKARVLVIDTFAQFARLVGDTENSAGTVLKAMMPLQEARDEKLAVWVIRHERKEGGGLGQSGRGSSAMSGAVDIILRLHKPEGRQAQNIRKLDAVSRFDDTPSELCIGFSEDGAGYQVLGETGAASHDTAMKAILTLLAAQHLRAIVPHVIHQRIRVVHLHRLRLIGA